MAYWLFKSEPDVFGWEDQVALGEAGGEWHGVRNYQARNHMRAMQPGDLGFFYHSQKGREVVGIVEVSGACHPDSTAGDPRWDCVDVRALRRLARPVTLDAIRAEPELGAPARGGLPATTARRTSDGWSLSGRKAYATGGEALAYHVVWVVTDEPVQRVGHLLVPADSPGISWIQTWDHLGLRASNTHDVEYDQVAVPLENFVEIPLTDGVYRDPAAAAGPGSFGHPALYLGVARAARSAFVAYLEWGTRLAVINSQPGAQVVVDAPMPQWGWGEVKGPYTG